jgi:hypothetical protein
VTLTLIATPPDQRDPKLSAAMRDATLGAILAGKKTLGADGRGPIAARAVGLRAVLREAEDVLSPGEMRLMGEWLDRMAEGDGGKKKVGVPPARGRRR